HAFSLEAAIGSAAHRLLLEQKAVIITAPQSKGEGESRWDHYGSLWEVVSAPPSQINHSGPELPPRKAALLNFALQSPPAEQEEKEVSLQPIAISQHRAGYRSECTRRGEHPGPSLDCARHLQACLEV
ncbi:hypothetical protein GOODEAATRI_007902, partial [Goodea atripinnis]